MYMHRDVNKAVNLSKTARSFAITWRRDAVVSFDSAELWLEKVFFLLVLAVLAFRDVSPDECCFLCTLSVLNRVLSNIPSV